MIIIKTDGLIVILKGDVLGKADIYSVTASALYNYI